MNSLKETAEIKEACHLCDDLLKYKPVRSAGNVDSRYEPDREPGVMHEAKAPPLSDFLPQDFQDSLLEKALKVMCRRVNFSGAALINRKGQVLAAYSLPMEREKISAFTSYVDATIREIPKAFSMDAGNYITVDLDQTDKVFVRRFRLLDNDLYMLAICPIDVEGRSEIDFSVKRIVSILR